MEAPVGDGGAGAEVAWGVGPASPPQAASNKPSGIKNMTNFLSFNPVISSLKTGVRHGS